MREAHGYLAEDGTFFDNQNSCNHYEANCKLIAAIKEHPILQGFSDADLDNIRRAVILFIIANIDALKLFIETFEPSLIPETGTVWDEANLNAASPTIRERGGGHP